MLYDLGVSALLSTMPSSNKFSFLTRIWSPGFNSGSGLAPHCSFLFVCLVSFSALFCTFLLSWLDLRRDSLSGN